MTNKTCTAPQLLACLVLLVSCGSSNGSDVDAAQKLAGETVTEVIGSGSQKPAAQTANDSAPADYLIRLVDPLDEPQFYCIDLAGWGENLRLDDPLQAHTCKTQRAEDQLLVFEEGRLRTRIYDRCLQAGASGSETLPGSGVIARPCSDHKLQQIVLEDSGVLKIKDTDYCIAAGSDSIPASGPSHMWRTLTVENCDAGSALTRWQIGLE